MFFLKNIPSRKSWKQRWSDRKWSRISCESNRRREKAADYNAAASGRLKPVPNFSISWSFLSRDQAISYRQPQQSALKERPLLKMKLRLMATLKKRPIVKIENLLWNPVENCLVLNRKSHLRFRQHNSIVCLYQVLVSFHRLLFASYFSSSQCIERVSKHQLICNVVYLNKSCLSCFTGQVNAVVNNSCHTQVTKFCLDRTSNELYLCVRRCL